MLVCLSAQCPGKINFYCWAMWCTEHTNIIFVFKAYIKGRMINWSRPTPCSRAGSVSRAVHWFAHYSSWPPCLKNVRMHNINFCNVKVRMEERDMGAEVRIVGVRMEEVNNP